MKKITLELTLAEARALSHAAEMGTLDESIDHIGFNGSGKAAFRRAESKLVQAIMDAEGWADGD